MGGMIDGLKRHTRGHGTITHNRHRATLFTELIGGDSHTQCRTNRGAGMANTKGIVVTLGALGETR